MISKEKYENAKEVILKYERQEYLKLPYKKGLYFNDLQNYPAIKDKKTGKITVIFRNILGETTHSVVERPEDKFHYFKETY